jgi:WD repeat-containing protein 23
MPFPSEAHHFKHPDDQSLATYRGHSVQQTLIRCYFSPMHRSGGNGSFFFIVDFVASILKFSINCFRKVIFVSGK